jgi:hypothetical protein
MATGSNGAGKNDRLANWRKTSTAASSRSPNFSPRNVQGAPF